MKKFLGLLSAVIFVMLITVGTVNAQEPEKKAENKAKTEECAKEKSKNCPTTCDKKAKAEKAEKTEKKKEKGGK